MEGNIRWIILLFLFSVHNCEGKTETKPKKKNVGLHLLFATFATLARKSDRVDMSGQRIHRTILHEHR